MNAWDSHVQRLQDEGRVFAALIVDDRGRVIASSENFLEVEGYELKNLVFALAQKHEALELAGQSFVLVEPADAGVLAYRSLSEPERDLRIGVCNTCFVVCLCGVAEVGDARREQIVQTLRATCRQINVEFS